MAQAARLCLRLQKELKLLLSDPPPGASFPRLSSAVSGAGDISSLSTIDAQIEGPEDTVYANGIFNVKIQIPERYPFQPPIVTFATPIYHPNIDNGGRICLDILNLPPKGAWQPSLNISTVLTSIGLLLSEPNPDDGLMCEASSEYKYNRQAFDHKARAMTEKHAKAGVTGSNISCEVQNSSNASMIHGNEKTSEAKSNGLAASDRNPSGTVPNHSRFLSNNHKDANGKRKAEASVENICHSEKPKMSWRKLSLPSSSQVQKKDENHEESSTTGMNNPQEEPFICQDTSAQVFSPYQGQMRTNIDSFTGKEHKESCSSFRRRCLGLKQPSINQECYKENAAPFNNLLTSNPQTVSAKSGRKLFLRPPKELQVKNTDNFTILEQKEMNQIQDDDVLPGDFKNTGMEEASLSEAIVADSDDSAEEGIESSRSRLSLARRGIGKQKQRA